MANLLTNLHILTVINTSWNEMISTTLRAYSWLNLLCILMRYRTSCAKYVMSKSHLPHFHEPSHILLSQMHCKGGFWAQWAATWQVVMGQYEPGQIVCIDEAGVDDHTNFHRSGWAALCEACVWQTIFLWGWKYSILPAVSLDGILTLDIFKGSVNQECFIQFLQNSLIIFTFICWQYSQTCIYQAPHLNPYPMDQSVVIMDNCSIHHDNNIWQVIKMNAVCVFIAHL